MTEIIFDTGEKLTVSKGTAFPIQRSIITTDVKKGGKVVTDRLASGSRSVTIDGSKDNLQILSGMFDVNVTDGSFDINAQHPCNVYQRGTNVFPDAFFQLKKVKLKKAAHGTDVDQVTFEGIVFNRVADFFKIMGNSEVTDLKIGSPDNYHTLDLSAITGSLSNTPVEGYVYPTMWKSDNVYKVSDFKPAIFYKTIWDAIFESHGFTYNWPALTDNDVQFDKVISPTVDKFSPTEEQILAEIVDIGTDLNPDPSISGSSPSSFTELTYPAFAKWSAVLIDDNGAIAGTNPYPGIGAVGSYMQIISVENQDPKGQYNTSSGVFTANLTAIYDFEFTIEFTVDLQTAAIADMNTPGGTGFLRYNFIPFVVDNAAGTAYELSGQSVQLDYYDGDTLAAGSNFTTGTYQGRITLDLNAGNTVSLMGFLLKMEGANQAEWQDASNDLINVEPNFTADSINVKILPRVNYQEGITIDLNAFLPKKKKQSEFVNDVLTMYNLIPITDPTDQNNILLYDRDTYYDQGTERDYSKKLATGKELLVEFMPNLHSKAIEISYKDDKDFHNQSYLNSVKQTYGQLRYIFENENTKGVDRQELSISPTPVGIAAFGGKCPFIPLDPEGLNMRALLYNGSADAGDYYFIQERDGTLNNVANFGAAHHVDDPINPGFDLNFGICQFYFYKGIRPTINNLFNLKYRRLFKQLNNGKRAVGWFDLTLADRQQLNLNDKIYINNSWWIIEKVEEDANNRSLTKMILLSIDDELSIRPVTGDISTDPLPTLPTEGISPGTPPIVKPGIDLSTLNNEDDTVYGGDNGGLSIEGSGNKVQPGVKTIIIYGDNNRVSSSKAYVFGDDIVANLPGMHVDKLYVNGRDTDNNKRRWLIITAAGDVQINPYEFDAFLLKNRGINVILPDPADVDEFEITIKDKGFGQNSFTTSAADIDGSGSFKIGKYETVTVSSVDGSYNIT